MRLLPPYNFLAYEVGDRDIAQLGSALPWGGRGHEFKSHCSDHLAKKALNQGLFSCRGLILCKIDIPSQGVE